MDEGRFDVLQSTVSNPGDLNRRGRTAVVIADSGTSADVVVFPASVNISPVSYTHSDAADDLVSV